MFCNASYGPMASERKGTPPDEAPVLAAHAEQLHTYAHDLRNRLAGLLEVLRQLRTSNTTNEEHELFAFGEQQVFAALRRTEEMLDTLGVPRSMPPPRTALVDLMELLRASIANQQYRLDRKQQRVLLPPASTITVAADPRQLGIVLEALLSNASKFSPIGSSITVQLRTADGQATMDVSDEGVGLSAADLEQVFVRYAWLDSTATAGEAQGRSTLARCKQIALAHGGSLTAHSDGVGKGCVFTLRSPVG